MQCKCGDEINNEIREVKTNAKAKEWMDGKDVVAPPESLSFHSDYWV